MYKPIHKLGQNFLTDKTAVKKIISHLDLKPDDLVIEIGPGLGFITEEISQTLIGRGSEIFAVEIDARFVEKLKTQFNFHPNIFVIQANVLDWLPGFNPNRIPYKMIGSLPYYITSPILHTVAKLPIKPEISIFLIQKEVAQKIVAKSPESSYLSVFIQTFFEVYYIDTIKKEEFTPIPDVDGGVIKLVKRKKQSVPFIKINEFEGFLHRAFSSPRKMLNKVFSEQELNALNINGSLRAQNLSWEEWVNAFQKLVF